MDSNDKDLDITKKASDSDVINEMTGGDYKYGFTTDIS